MYNEQQWTIAPKNLSLSANQVHVWRAPLSATQDVRASMERVLSEEERKRAARFHFERDRQSWIIAHGILRMLLARYLQLEPQQVRFVANEYGKPALAP